MSTLNMMEQLRGTFRAEALDLLIELDSSLLALETESADSTLVHRVFRAIHTIKGSGATVGFKHLAKFAHKVEEAFDLARDGRLEVTPELIDCGLKACDVLRLIMENSNETAEIPGEVEVTAAFTRLLQAPADALAPVIQESKPVPAIRATFDIIFKPKREMFYSGADPVTVLDDLRELGQAHLTAHADQVPQFASLDAEQCYLWWEILLVTDRDQAAIQDVFVFVEDDCQVSVRRRKDESAAVALLGSVPAEAFSLFVVECEDHLAAIERDALVLEREPASRASLDSVFRGVHSIKGNAGVLLGQVDSAALGAGHPLPLLLRVAHALESLLEPFRKATGEAVSNQMVQTVLETCDAIRTLMASLAHGDSASPISPDLLQTLGVQTSTLPKETAADDGREAAFLNTTAQCVEMIAGCFERMETHDEFKGPALKTYVRGLKTLSAAAHYRNCPELQEPLTQQLRIVEAAVQTGAALSREELSILKGAFQAVRGILNRLFTPGPGPSPGLDSRLSDRAVAAPAMGEIPPDRPASAPSSTIRIDQTKLDQLIRVVGELLVARGAFPLLIQKLTDGVDGSGLLKDLKDAGASISRIANELQSSVLSIRMLPVKTTFQRFPRLVRDLARSLGKEVRLVMEGEDIELDKTILEQIGDPLVHLMRNAVDHGLEPPEERRAKGKDPSGQLTLRAFRETGGVTIEVTEDGRGLDAEALKRKAIEKGLITPQAATEMSDEAAFQLVFLPGLTTAAKISDVSGRGVGMDVVRSNIRNLQGAIEIQSKPGQGTTVLLKLPTSLMISKGVLLEAGGQQYILPLGSIHDMVKLPRQETHEYPGFSLAAVRGTTYSLFSLAKMLNLGPTEKAASDRGPADLSTEVSVAIVGAQNAKYGLVVDRFLTEVEVLVKPLTGGLEQCQEFQGAAIMGDGRIVLVLNALECHKLNQSSRAA